MPPRAQKEVLAIAAKHAANDAKLVAALQAGLAAGLASQLANTARAYRKPAALKGCRTDSYISGLLRSAGL